MKRLIKADLAGVLNMVPTYFPVPEACVKMEIARLSREEQADFLFLARREKCWLFDIPSVYTPDSYANLAWTYAKHLPKLPVAVLYLHVDKIVEGRPWGSVTLLDYQVTLEDVDQFAPLPLAQRERHIWLLVRRWLRDPRHCSLLEVMEYLKKRGENPWM